MRERLQKLISSAGLASRRAAEELIAAGRVTINGVTATVGMSADPETDEIRLDGVLLPRPDRRRYIVLNKPRGFVCTLSDECGRRTVTELIGDIDGRLYPVGRLDMYSEGLLLMTDDGRAANALTQPGHEIPKTYRVSAHGANIEAAAENIRRQRELDGLPIRPVKCRILSSSGDSGELEIIITEGKNRQIRRMCAAAGLRVSRLVRIAEGEIRLGALQSGRWRELTAQELRWLRGVMGG